MQYKEQYKLIHLLSGALLAVALLLLATPTISQAESQATENNAQETTAEKTNKPGTKCLTVCARWDKSCSIEPSDRGARGKRCQQTCKRFKQECFELEQEEDL